VIIDSLLEDLGNIFTGSAMQTFGTFNCKNIDSKINKNKNGQNQEKAWFDQDCKFARQEYRRSKRRYKLNNTIRNLNPQTLRQCYFHLLRKRCRTFLNYGTA
jgi:hypothetical protein